MKILLTGSTGQVGYELTRSLEALGELVALDRSKMDLADLTQIRNVIRSVKPDLIVNPAAYTAVDKAESEPYPAQRVNGEAPAVMAEEAKKCGAAMIHYSTDYVFDGSKGSPYLESDAPCPINVYGRTKLFGEQAIQSAGIPHLILRTSWVYGGMGKNFLLTMLRLAAERDALRVVGDQHGSPTWSRTIAEATATILGQAKRAADPQEWWAQHAGLYHLTAQGQTTWFGFTQEILRNACMAKTPALTAIATAEYPLPAPRPAYSVMSSDRLINTFTPLPEWRDALARCQLELR